MAMTTPMVPNPPRTTESTVPMTTVLWMIRAEQLGNGAGFELAHFIRGADEEIVHGGNASAFFIRCEQLNQRVSYDDADIVHRAAEKQHQERQPKPA